MNRNYVSVKSSILQQECLAKFLTSCFCVCRVMITHGYTHRLPSCHLMEGHGRTGWVPSLFCSFAVILHLLRTPHSFVQSTESFRSHALPVKKIRLPLSPCCSFRICFRRHFLQRAFLVTSLGLGMYPWCPVSITRMNTLPWTCLVNCCSKSYSVLIF